MVKPSDKKQIQSQNNNVFERFAQDTCENIAHLIKHKADLAKDAHHVVKDAGHITPDLSHLKQIAAEKIADFLQHPPL